MYFTIGVIAMALLAALVIFTVIARYFFSLSWKQLSEFNTTLFAFTVTGPFLCLVVSAYAFATISCISLISSAVQMPSVTH